MLLTPRFLLLALCFMLLAAPAFAQAVLNKTDFGKSQNTDADLMNSLIPGKPSLTKGEKKAEVDPKTLQSKKVKDPAFEGNLMDIGLDWTGDKMGKPRTTTDPDSKAAKGGQATANQDSKSSKDAESSHEKEAKVSKSDAADAQNKDEKQPSAKSGEKPSDKEKGGKADGDH
jgi:hypothetical protein